MLFAAEASATATCTDMGGFDIGSAAATVSLNRCGPSGCGQGNLTPLCHVSGWQDTFRESASCVGFDTCYDVWHYDNTIEDCPEGYDEGSPNQCVAEAPPDPCDWPGNGLDYAEVDWEACDLPGGPSTCGGRQARGDHMQWLSDGTPPPGNFNCQSGCGLGAPEVTFGSGTVMYDYTFTGDSCEGGSGPTGPTNTYTDTTESTTTTVTNTTEPEENEDGSTTTTTTTTSTTSSTTTGGAGPAIVGALGEISGKLDDIGGCDDPTGCEDFEEIIDAADTPTVGDTTDSLDASEGAIQDVHDATVATLEAGGEGDGFDVDPTESGLYESMVDFLTVPSCSSWHLDVRDVELEITCADTAWVRVALGWLLGLSTIAQVFFIVFRGA